MILQKWKILHYNGSNSFLFINAPKIYHLKAKDSETKNHSLCLAIISEDFSVKKNEKGKIECINLLNE